MKEKEQFPRIIPRVSKGAAGLLALCLILILVFGLSGCSGRGSLKDNVLDGFNDLLLYFSDQALTEDKDLHGTRIAGEDSYTGTYTGDYEGFSGKEYLFGGTSLAREKGKNLNITYNLHITSGEARLYWQEKETTHTIARDSQDGTYTISLSGGDNYITLEGEDFTGTLSIVVE